MIGAVIGAVTRWARTPLPWLAALIAAYLLVPIGAFLVRLVRAEGGYVEPGLASALAVSAVTASVSAVVIALLGVPLAYLLARARSRISDLVGVLVALPLALPPLMSGILLIYLVGYYTPLGRAARLFGVDLTNSLVGIVLAQVFVAAPFLIVAARSAFAALDPALDDVAATLGHGRWARFTRVALPGALPGIGAGLLLAWLRAFGEFGATVVLAYHPYSLPVYLYVQFGSTGLPATLAPVGAGLGAAFAVLALAYLAPRLRRPYARPRLPEPRAPSQAAAGGLAFRVEVSVDSFDLRLAYSGGGQRLAILGPSGAGKTLTLRALAGLLAPDHGQVRLGARVLTGLPPEHRGLGYVPQDPTLLPRLPVWRQVTFGVDADPALAAYWVRRLHLEGLEARLPHELSGGQRRRVAVARALAHQPSLLLLDEPFTALDVPIRDELRRELRSLQRDTGVATVLVTHDPEEAALLADDVLLVAGGALVQAGDQPSVYGSPANPLAAHLLGIRNLATGRIGGPGVVVSHGLRLPVPDPDLPYGTPVTWCIRPEHIHPDPEGHPARVVDAVDLGGLHEAVFAVGDGLRLTIRTVTPRPLTPGADIAVALPPSAITTWPRDDIPGSGPGGAAAAPALPGTGFRG